jgi:hypothetical protein
MRSVIQSDGVLEYLADAFAGLSFPDWLALPLTARMSQRLADMLVLLDEISLELETEDSAALRWLEPQIQRLYRQVDTVLGRLAQ